MGRLHAFTPQIHSSANVHRQDNFRPDLELPADSRKTLRDFEEPVFDRGHLVSSASLDAERSNEFRNILAE